MIFFVLCFLLFLYFFSFSLSCFYIRSKHEPSNSSRRWKVKAPSVGRFWPQLSYTFLLPLPVCYTDPLGLIDPLTSDNTPSSDPKPDPTSINHKMHKNLVSWFSGKLLCLKLLLPRCQILRLKCTKSFVGRGSAPDPAGGAYSAPRTPYLDFRRPTSKEGEGRGPSALPLHPQPLHSR